MNGLPNIWPGEASDDIGTPGPMRWRRGERISGNLRKKASTVIETINERLINSVYGLFLVTHHLPYGVPYARSIIKLGFYLSSSPPRSYEDAVAGVDVSRRHITEKGCSVHIPRSKCTHSISCLVRHVAPGVSLEDSSLSTICSFVAELRAFGRV